MSKLIFNGHSYTGGSINPITIDAIISAIYPVGSIYMSVNNVNPGTYLTGTTWEAWGSGRVPVGVDTSQTEFDTVEETGGEKTHALTTSEMPSHMHALNIAGGSTDKASAGVVTGWQANQTKYYMDSSFIQPNGSGAGHNNLPPYITCYMWKRTA